MVLKPRAEAPIWDGFGDPEKAGKCLRFPPRRLPDNSIHDPYGSDDEEEQLEAAAICNGTFDGIVCPLRQECLEWSLINNEQFCVYGGMLPHDRLKIRLARRADPYMEIEWHAPTPKDPELDEPELEDAEEEDSPDGWPM
jgi:hypothetical protein